ncbi:MAG TPA: response regulator [Burkholderiaceae bacterium]|nr:response regulator [Burkholderiaceae bacterium]
MLGVAPIGYRRCYEGGTARDAFCRILTSGRLLMGIIDDMLEIEAGKLELESVRVDFGRSVSHAVGQTAQAAGGSDRQRLAGTRILLAEDNLVNQQVVEYLLASEGAEVLVAENGARAIERIHNDGRNAYDIVLMDIQMPEMDGYEAARRIRQLWPDLPIVAQTAHAFAEERDKCFEAGMVDHLVKPIDRNELVQSIQRHTRPRTQAALVL